MSAVLPMAAGTALIHGRRIGMGRGGMALQTTLITHRAFIRICPHEADRGRKCLVVTHLTTVVEDGVSRGQRTRLVSSLPAGKQGEAHDPHAQESERRYCQPVYAPERPPPLRIIKLNGFRKLFRSMQKGHVR